MAAVKDAPAGCGQAQTTTARTVALASMGIEAPLYMIEDSGRLVKMDLRTGANSILSDHRFYHMPTLRPSGDGRWLSYSGVLKGADKSQYWLYDRQTQTEQLVFEHPAWGGDIPRFSPDSRYLAISASHDSRWPNASRAGIYLFDTTTKRLHSVKLPALEANRTARVSADWSQDGKTLLILVRNMLAKEGFYYFSYRLDTTKIKTLSGRYNRTGLHHEFFHGAKAVPAAKEIPPRSIMAERAAWSPGRTWHAHFDQRQDSLPYQLVITNKKGVITPVAVGRNDHCLGRTLHIIGWLDGRHLVYRNAMDYFVFDTDTGATASLVSEEDMPMTFTW